MPVGATNYWCSTLKGMKLNSRMAESGKEGRRKERWKPEEGERGSKTSKVWVLC